MTDHESTTDDSDTDASIDSDTQGESTPPADRFADAPISRRQFAKLSAAVGASLALPGNATASVSSEKYSTEYQYVVEHTPTDFAVPTLVTFSDAAGFAEFETIADDPDTTTETSQPAGFAHLTTTQSTAVAELPTAETLSHSPGSNPFWRLGYYPMGVFPDAERSTGYIDFEQMIDGLQYLEGEHADRMRFYEIGDSPGHYNEISARDDPKGVYVAEITNDIDDQAAFEAKEKVFYSLSLHGLERAGAEAGSRYIERLLRGNDPEVEQLLDDVVLVFCYTNPDGWVAKHPQYESGWQLLGPEDGAPVAPFYERGNAGVYDTNRQYPTVGWITTSHYPAEPEEPADRSLARTTDAMAIVEHFRTYQNLNYGADLHGMNNSAEFVLGLISQDQFDTRDLHELYEMNRVIDETLEDALGNWNTMADFQELVTGGTNPAPLGFGTLPEQAFDYSTIWDTIDYTVSGAMGDWMAHPEELGGLGMTTMDFEMAFSHMVGANVFHPELVDMQVTGYETAIRTIADYAVRNSDTPNTTDEFSAAIETGGEDTAYVTTDALTRSSEDLSFLASDGPTMSWSGIIGPGATGAENTASHTFDTADFSEGPSRVEATLSWSPAAQDLELYLEDPDGNQIAAAETADNPETLSAALEADGEYTLVVETWANAASQYEIEATFPGAETTTTTSSSTDEQRVPALGTTTASYTLDADVDSLTVHPHAHEGLLQTELVAPDGTVVRSFDPDGEHAAGGRCCSHPEWTVTDPAQGTWTVEVENLVDAPEHLKVYFGTLAAPASPDPREALGYDQTAYEVSPFQFFEDYAAAVADGGSVDPVSRADVKDGALADYDNVVVIHDDGRFDTDYTAAIDEFVESGGNLVLSDSGVHLLAELETDLADSVSRDDVSDQTFYIGHLGEKDANHPLLTDARPIQQALYKIAPLGYSTGGEAPMTLVEEDAFRLTGASGSAAPSIAATTDGKVSAGSITRGGDDPTGIHVVGGLLPPASQGNLHPFGLLDYTTSFLGYLVLSNALGFTQTRTTADGGRSFGWSEWQADVEDPPFSVSGTRSDDGSAFTGGQTNQVTVSVTPSRDATVRDEVPTEWTVLTGYSDDVASVEEQGGRTVVTFGPTASAGSTTEFTYFAEAPSGADQTGTYEFGPVTASPDGEDWVTVSDTTETNTVLGEST
ncbi:M14 family metallopeptidase [Haloarchaeobius sp. TZWSO28]|uniref:M14 family metallopeptidase n=1 Tax=Haloarchaeobius sp. TZWSO28 TaxID=3446119 RepID=UPI003EB95C0D